MTRWCLVVEDESPLGEMLVDNLVADGLGAELVRDGARALDRLERGGIDLVVLDIMLPNVDGFEVLRRMRARGDATPVLVLSARASDQDRIRGLELRADDYLTKPFNPRELVARVKAILRRTDSGRAAGGDDRPLRVGNLVIDPARRVVLVGDRPVDLRAKEFDLLLALADNKSIVLSREKLLDIVWGFDFYGQTRTVDVHIAHLRTKLAGSTAEIETVWGVGYKLSAP